MDSSLYGVISKGHATEEQHAGMATYSYQEKLGSQTAERGRESLGNYVAFRLQLYDIMPSQISAAVVPISKALLVMCSCHRT